MCVKTLTKHTDEVWQALFSEDGKYLATVAKNNILIIWKITKFESEIEIKAVLGRI